MAIGNLHPAAKVLCLSLAWIVLVGLSGASARRSTDANDNQVKSSSSPTSATPPRLAIKPTAVHRANTTRTRVSKPRPQTSKPPPTPPPTPSPSSQTPTPSLSDKLHSIAALRPLGHIGQIFGHHDKYTKTVTATATAFFIDTQRQSLFDRNLVTRTYTVHSTYTSYVMVPSLSTTTKVVVTVSHSTIVVPVFSTTTIVIPKTLRL